MAVTFWNLMLGCFERIIGCSRIEKIYFMFHLLVPRRIGRNIPASSTSIFLSQFIASATLDLSLLSLSRTWLYSLCLQWLAWCLPSPGLLWLFSLLITYVSRSLFKVTYCYEKQLQIVFEASHRQNLVLFHLVMIILMCGLSSVVSFYSENLECSFFSLCIFFLRWNPCNKINHFKA